MASTKFVAMETKSLVEEYDFTWKINNFSRYIDEIESAVFAPLSNVKTHFSVKIQFEKSSTGCKILLIKRTDQDILNNLKVVADLKFIDVQGSELKRLPKSRDLHFYSERLIIGTIYYEQRYTNCPLDIFNINKRPNNDIVIMNIRFEFFGHAGTSKLNTRLPMKSPQQNFSSLSTDLKALYNSKILTDISIQIDETALQAHQSVLAARSPVFKRMLESSCLESKTKYITITDVEVDVFEYFLKYLYSGDVEDKAFTTAWRLYSVADKYAVLSLLEECGNILASNLNAENVVSVLELSYLHTDNLLKEKAIYFISTYFSEVKSKPEWDEIMKKYPELASEVLGSISIALGSISLVLG